MLLLFIYYSISQFQLIFTSVGVNLISCLYIKRTKLQHRSVKQVVVFFNQIFFGISVLLFS